MEILTKEDVREIKVRPFIRDYRRNVQKMEKCLTEMEKILVSDYGLLGDKKLCNPEPAFQDFLENEKYHSKDEKFSSLMFRAGIENLENDLNIMSLRKRYDKLQTKIEPLNPFKK